MKHYPKENQHVHELLPKEESV